MKERRPFEIIVSAATVYSSLVTPIAVPSLVEWQLIADKNR